MEARSDLPSFTRESDIKHVLPWYQQEAPRLDYSEYAQPDGVCAGLGRSGLQEPLVKEGGVTRSLEVSSHYCT